MQSQVIDEDCKYSCPELSFGWASRYHVLAIMGSQSTGKSTLLNQLFNCGFQVLNSRGGRKQTTRGVWVSGTEDLPLLVMDVEGSDSKERWQKRSSIEQSTGLFALCVADLLVVNLWTKEVGRYTASQYGIIRTIMELNIRLFKQQSPKQILILLRDFDPRENLQRIRGTILADLDNIWADIPKTEEQRALPADAYYQVHFATLPHFIYQRTEFDKEIDLLRARLVDPSREDYCFKGEIASRLPIKSLSMYMANIWDVIVNQKDLNIPQEKVIIASQICYQLRTALLTEAKAAISKLRYKEFKSAEELSGELKSVKEQVLGRHKAQTQAYNPKVVNQSQQELKDKILGMFQQIFKDYCEQERQSLLQSFNIYIKKLRIEKGKYSNIKLEQLSSSIAAFQSDLNARYSSTIEHLEISPNWRELETRKGKQLFEELSRRVVRDLLQKVQNNRKAAMVSRIARLLSTRALDPVLERPWDNLADELTTITDGYNQDVKLVHGYFGLEYSKQLGVAQVMDNDLLKALFQIKNIVSESLIAHLRNQFELGEQKKPVNWKMFEEEQIKARFQKAKVKVLARSTSFGTVQVGTGSRQAFTQQDIKEQVGKFEKAASQTLDSAVNKMRTGKGMKVPAWLWTLLAVFVVDDLLVWITSPWLLVPLLLILAVIGVSFAVGEKDLPAQFAKDTFRRMSMKATDVVRNSVVNRIL